ncbi:MAG: DUF4430 domain-containing protein [Patescibacteria group bacterium]
MKKYIALFITIVALGAGSYFTEQSFRTSFPRTEPPLASAISTATLIAGKNQYEISASDGTVLQAMQRLASTSNFAFTGKDYPSLGFFVESINDKKNAGGFYWILYLNGKASDLGASQAKIHAGDEIEWKYEKGY